jgi:hypothetical protein
MLLYLLDYSRLLNSCFEQQVCLFVIWHVSEVYVGYDALDDLKRVAFAALLVGPVCDKSNFNSECVVR